MTKLVSLPMYDINPSETDSLWQALAALLQQRHVFARFCRPDDLQTHWRNDRLLLSQTCGYPLMTRLFDVQLVGCFTFDAPGCVDRHYRSLLVVRASEQGRSLADYAQRRAVANSWDSHSGYNALRYLCAPLSHHGKFFSEIVFSGSHRQSLIALKRNQADIAAIDCITWALLQRHQPELLEGLAVTGETPLAPGLPLVTSAMTDAETLSAVQDALHQLVNDPITQPLCQALLIRDFCLIDRDAYQPIIDWEQQAGAWGVTTL